MRNPPWRGSINFEACRSRRTDRSPREPSGLAQDTPSGFLPFRSRGVPQPLTSPAVREKLGTAPFVWLSAFDLELATARSSFQTSVSKLLAEAITPHTRFCTPSYVGVRSSIIINNKAALYTLTSRARGQIYSQQASGKCICRSPKKSYACGRYSNALD